MTRVLLKFGEKHINQPITAQVILELGVGLNIIRADIKPAGGEILIEIPTNRVEDVVAAFQGRGVAVIVERRLEVDEEQCIDCGSCYSLCPTSAISFKDDYTVVFDKDKCVACGLCIDACPTRALTLL
jgi:NAD-dependent dihydropyrimidine dehydrogenase PreA subunit